MLLWTIAPGVDNTNGGSLSTSQDPDILGPRILVTATWAIGVLHMFFVMKTFLAWSGPGNTIEFDQRRLEEGDVERVPETIQLPSGSHSITNPQLPLVPLQIAALTPDIRAEIPLAREDDEQDIPMEDITSKWNTYDLSTDDEH
jgi:hypothetical protein